MGPMDEPNERREFRDLFARRWGALLKWLALRQEANRRRSAKSRRATARPLAGVPR